MSATRPTPRPWRLPRGKPRRVRTPLPPRPTPLPVRRSTPLPRPSIAFETVTLDGRPVGVSGLVVAQFSLLDLFEAVRAHGPARSGARQTKHTVRRKGTFVVLSNGSGIFIVTPAELRVLQPPQRVR